MLIGQKLAIHPNGKQDRRLRELVGSCRYLFNEFLNLNISEHEASGKFIFYEEMCRLLTKLKKEHRWLKKSPSQPLQQTLKHLETAIKSVWERGFGFPGHKSRSRDEDSATFPQGFKFRDGEIYLPVIGWIPYRSHRDFDPSRVRNVTVRLDRLRNRWIISLCINIDAEPLPKTGRCIGIDAGSVRLLTDSEGNFIPALRDDPIAKTLLAKIEKAQGRFSDIVSKIKNGRKIKLLRAVKELMENREKDPEAKKLLDLLDAFKKDLQLAHRRLANYCEDRLHKLSRGLVERFDVIAAEDLNLKDMTKSARGTVENPGKNVSQKSGLNRNLLSNRIGTLFQMLAFKCRRYGKEFIQVNPANTSRRCSACGFIDRNNRMTQAGFRCLRCGHEMNADHNAAVNILNIGLKARLVSGSPSA